jgi:hypothetical protein
VCKAFQFPDDEFLLLENWVRRLAALEDEARTLIGD